MPSLYSITQTDQGYKFTTDSGVVYTVFFTTYYLDDAAGNEHVVYNFGFDRNGSFNSNKFEYGYDQKIKYTIINLVTEFFQKNDSNALIYFCFPNDELARHRSIAFGKWCSETDSDVEHQKGSIVYQDQALYGGILVKKSNPLKSLLVDAFRKHVEIQMF